MNGVTKNSLESHPWRRRVIPSFPREAQNFPLGSYPRKGPKGLHRGGVGLCGPGALPDSYWQKSPPFCKVASCQPLFIDIICGPERSKIASVTQQVPDPGTSSRLGTHFQTLAESKPSPEVAQLKGGGSGGEWPMKEEFNNSPKKGLAC